jgi:hypothetical protein
MVFDTHAIARQLAQADPTPEQVDAITDAVRRAAEHGEHVTPDQQRADLATLRADIYRAMLIQTAATIGGTGALLRLLG